MLKTRSSGSQDSDKETSRRDRISRDHAVSLRVQSFNSNAISSFTATSHYFHLQPPRFSSVLHSATLINAFRRVLVKTEAPNGDAILRSRPAFSLDCDDPSCLRRGTSSSFPPPDSIRTLPRATSSNRRTSKPTRRPNLDAAGVSLGTLRDNSTVISSSPMTRQPSPSFLQTSLTVIEITPIQPDR